MTWSAHISDARLASMVLLLLVGTSSEDVLCQKTVGGKLIRQGVWHERTIEYVEGQIAVKIGPTASVSEIEPSLAQHQAKLIGEVGKLRWYLVEIPPTQDVFTVVESLGRNAMIESVEPNGIMRALFDPDDPFYQDGHQWALRNTGQSPPGGTPDADIDVDLAWDISKGSSDVTIAILDSGIPLNDGALCHPDLDDPGRIIIGPDFVDVPPYSDPTVKDELGHGTHVAGIAASEFGNNSGIAGVAPNCGMLICQVFNAAGDGPWISVANGIVYAVDHGARVINFSGGGAQYSQLLEDAVKYAYEHDVVMCVGAGNNYGNPVLYPGRFAGYGTYPGFEDGYENVLCVSATGPNDEIAPYSNQGLEVNVAAPGGMGGELYDVDDVYSTTPNYFFYMQIGHPELTQGYGYVAGTSMATPHVTGICGLLLSLNANLTPAQVRAIVQETADDRGAPGRDDLYGYGRVNAFEAVKYTIEHFGGTIASGQTCTFAPGLIFNFQESGRLIVYGSLVVDGTANSRVTIDGQSATRNGIPWAMVVIASGGSADIHHADFRNAGYQLTLWTNSGTSIVENCSFTAFGYSSESKALSIYSVAGPATVTNNTFTGSNYQGTALYCSGTGTNVSIVGNTVSNAGTGIRVYSSNAQLTGNTLRDNIYYGIQADNVASTADYRGNDVRACGYGLSLNSAAPSIMFNTFAEGATVIVNSCSPNFWTHPEEEDDMRGHNTVASGAAPLLRAQNYAFPYAGYGYSGGYNSVFDCDLPHVWACNNSGIYAANNYWAGAPTYFADGTSWVVATNPLPTNPNPDPLGKRAIVWSLDSSPQSLRRLEGAIDDTTWENAFRLAISTSISGDPLAARRELENVIHSGSIKFAPLALLVYYDLSRGHWGSKHGVAEVRAALDSLLQNLRAQSAATMLRPFALRLLARDAAISKDHGLANAYRTEILKDYPNSTHEVATLYDLVMYCVHVENCLEKAREVVARMNSEYADDNLSRFARIEIGEKADLPKREMLQSLAKGGPISNPVLDPIFPNPFNPTTTIRFQMPEAGLVSLTIHDVLGRRVASIINEEKAAGTHSVVWTASNMPSGICFLRLDALGRSITQKLVLIR